MRRQKRATCTNSDYKKWKIQAIKANLGKNGQQPKFIKGLAKYSNEMAKSGMLTVGDFYKSDKFSEIATLARSNEWLAK